MNSRPRHVLDRIGGTQMLALRRIAAATGCRILLKLESENPTGSMKDRMALAMIEAAEADGRLPPGGAVVEYTGGSTGVSLALVCAVKGHRLHIVTSDAFAREKLDHMRILGAELEIIASEGGGMTARLTRDMIDAAARIAAATGGYWTDQLNNRDQLGAYHRMAEEIRRQADGRIDAFVQCVGTAASLRGTAESLRRGDPRIRIVAVEPAESAVLSGGASGAHKIDGVGAGFVVPLWQAGIADAIERVSTAEARAMAHRSLPQPGRHQRLQPPQPAVADAERLEARHGLLEILGAAADMPGGLREDGGGLRLGHGGHVALMAAIDDEGDRRDRAVRGAGGQPARAVGSSDHLALPEPGQLCLGLRRIEAVDEAAAAAAAIERQHQAGPLGRAAEAADQQAEAAMVPGDMGRLPLDEAEAWIPDQRAIGEDPDLAAGRRRQCLGQGSRLLGGTEVAGWGRARVGDCGRHALDQLAGQREPAASHSGSGRAAAASARPPSRGSPPRPAHGRARA
jgi:cysteine synthase A